MKQFDLSRTIDYKKPSHLENTSNISGSASRAAPKYTLEGDHQNTKSTQFANNKKEPQSTGESLTFYCHGFLFKRDFFGNNYRSENGERFAGEDYNNYWSGDKKGEPRIDNQFEERFTGEAPVSANTYYLDGSAGALTSAEDRYRYGLSAGDRIFEKYKFLKSGQEREDGHKENKNDVDLNAVVDNNGCITNKINIVGHSMGAAYAAGLATRLLEYNQQAGKKIFDIRAVYYLAPHQPMHFTHPSSVRGIQYSHKEDRVSSTGFIPGASGSKLGPIQGISEYKVFDVGYDNDEEKYNTKMMGENGERGGHNVGLHQYIFDAYERGQEGYVSVNSDSVYDNYENEGPTPEKPKDRFLQIPKILDFPRTAYEWTGNKLRQLANGIKKLGSNAKRKLKKLGRRVKNGGKSIWNKIKSWF